MSELEVNKGVRGRDYLLLLGFGWLPLLLLMMGLVKLPIYVIGLLDEHANRSTQEKLFVELQDYHNVDKVIYQKKSGFWWPEWEAPRVVSNQGDIKRLVATFREWKLIPPPGSVDEPPAWVRDVS